MEHRWGRREAVNVPIRVKWRSLVVARGRLVNASISGALARTDDRPPLWSRVDVELELDGAPGGEPHSIAAYVVRQTREGVGLEWCEFAPASITLLLARAQEWPEVAEQTG